MSVDADDVVFLFLMLVGGILTNLAEQPVQEEGGVPRQGRAIGGRECAVHEPPDKDVLQGVRAGGHVAQ